MTTEDYKRRLRAILSADVEGYSKLMGEDEDNTVRTLTTYRKIMASLIERYHGRVVDSPGDNLLAEFESVRDAVSCAVEIQNELRIKNSERSENRRMQFRIGINLGDVITEGNRIYGDGVNVAARIESLADAGGICLSRSAYDQVKRKITIKYDYLGEHEVKNIDEPVRVYKVLMDSIPDDVLPKKKSEEKISIEKKTSASSEKPSIVVLPFVNMSNDPDQEYFSDGMSEEIIGALAKLEGLKVISRTSAFFFKGKDVNLRTIGHELNVEHVLEGSVRKSGNKIRITAQLIKVLDDTHLWSENYDRELEDVFAIQDEISHAVVEKLKVKLLKKASEPLVKDYTKSIDAYELFLKGKYIINKGDFLDTGKALDYFERAIRTDPEFAPAYSILAITYTAQGTLISLPSNEMWSKVNTLALKALELDDMDSYTHIALGRIKAYYEFDWQGAEISYKRAIDLNPSNGDTHLDYGIYLVSVGRAYEAIKEMKRALELDPVSISINSFLGLALLNAGEVTEGIKQAHKTLELSSTASMPLTLLAFGYAEQGMYEEGIKILQQVEDIPLIQTGLANMYIRAGKKKEARKILDSFLVQSEKGYFSPCMIAGVYASLGEKDKAFEWLEKAVEEHDVNIWNIKINISYNELHSDSRWMNLMGKMNLKD